MGSCRDHVTPNGTTLRSSKTAADALCAKRRKSRRSLKRAEKCHLPVRVSRVHDVFGAMATARSFDVPFEVIRRMRCREGGAR